MVRRETLLVLFPIALLAGCKSTKAPLRDVSALENPATCRPCHAAIDEEWQDSLHAGAHADPIFVGLRTLRSKKEQDLETKCAVCHAPVKADTGVTCFACHATASVHADLGRGSHALSWSRTGTLFGPSDLPADRTPVHGTSTAPSHMKDGTSLCLACHGDLANENEVPVCQTATEWKATKTSKTCVDCHMKRADGAPTIASPKTTHRSHRFAGPRGLWTHTLTAVAALEMVGLDAQRVDGVLEVRLENRTGHAFPSGFPGRFAKLSVSNGDWSEEAFLGKRYVDAEGQPVIAAYGVKIASDTRLLPGETRVLKFEAPAGTVTVKLVHGLLPPPLAEKIELMGELAKPRVLATAKVE